MTNILPSLTRELESNNNRHNILPKIDTNIKGFNTSLRKKLTHFAYSSSLELIKLISQLYGYINTMYFLPKIGIHASTL